MDLLRGRVYSAPLDMDEAKLWLVVSNNARNRGLRDALVVRLTTTAKYQDLDSVVAIPGGESVMGFVRCDSLTTMYEDEPEREVCALSSRAMKAVEAGLRATLGMS